MVVVDVFIFVQCDYKFHIICSMHCDYDHPYTQTNAQSLCNIVNHLWTWNLLHVLAINHHPRADVIQRHIKPTHPVYICSAKNKMPKINNDCHKDRNVVTVDNLMLTYSWIKFIDIPVVWHIIEFYSGISMNFIQE